MCMQETTDTEDYIDSPADIPQWSTVDVQAQSKADDNGGNKFEPSERELQDLTDSGTSLCALDT